MTKMAPIVSAGLAQVNRGGGPPPPPGISLVVPPGPALDRFVAAAAAHGLAAPDAVRLALERELTLADSDGLGWARELTRHVLTTAAGSARARRALTPAQAAYVRSLTIGRPVRSVDVSQGLTVGLPERMRTRLAGPVPGGALDAGVVPEMVGWETAAALDGRSMAEWALKILLVARSAA